MIPKIELVTSFPHAHIVTATKPLVDALLELNTKNRAMRPNRVTNYRRAIEEGNWVLTNQGIGVSRSGILLDGQNRLKAIELAGYPPVKFLLVTGLTDEAAAAIDIGATRSGRDYLYFLFDARVSAQVAAILRTSFLARYNFQKACQPSPNELAETLIHLGDSIEAILTIPTTKKMSSVVLAALADAHSAGYEDQVMSFTEAVTTGAMLPKDSPALQLRVWMSRYRGRGGQEAMVERYLKTARALKAWIDGEKLGKLYGAKTGKRKKTDNTDEISPRL